MRRVKAQDHHIGPLCPRLGHTRQGLRGDEGCVAVQDHGVAGKPFKRGARLRHRMGRAKLLVLLRRHRLRREHGQRRGHRCCAMTGHHHDPFGTKRRTGFEDMTQQGIAAHLMQDLGQVRHHPAALPGREHDQCCLVSCHALLALKLLGAWSISALSRECGCADARADGVTCSYDTFQTTLLTEPDIAETVTAPWPSGLPVSSLSGSAAASSLAASRAATLSSAFRVAPSSTTKMVM